VGGVEKWEVEWISRPMHQLPIFQKRHAPLKMVFLGAHSDDIELGCGGTILKLLDDHDGVDAHWVVFSANHERRTEAEKSASIFLDKAAKKEIILKEFKESFFPYHGSVIKEYFETLKHAVNPDIIFTHYRGDLHQDHRLISELTWNTFRNHLILEYEIVKYDGDLGKPNCFVHLNDEICSRKIKHLVDHFRSQRSHHWFTEETFRSILRLRGVESNAPDQYAEAFYCRKIVIG
jgi:LmbE family N-acetylglucosaminyl deacetylase